jgi:transposase
MQSQFKDLTDSQWEVILPFLKNNKPKELCLREVLNGIFWITRTGSQWRNLESRFPKWQSVYYYFNKWSKDNTIALIMNTLTKQERIRQNRDIAPSLSIVDSQSVKSAPFICLDKGVDGHKKINGRKRHIAVDTLGLPLAIYVGKANQHDGEAGLELLALLDEMENERLKVIRGDKAYRGTFTDSAIWYNWEVDTTQPPPSEKGFVPAKNRWQVERTFGWINFYRRLSKDYEKTVTSSVAFLQLTFCNILIARNCPF